MVASLRALYGRDGTRNAVHGSDSIAAAAVELRFFFPELHADPLPSTADMELYVEQQLNPILSQGLAELIRTKPTSQPLEGIAWLAAWLLKNNFKQVRSCRACTLWQQGPSNGHVCI